MQQLQCGLKCCRCAFCSDLVRSLVLLGRGAYRLQQEEEQPALEKDKKRHRYVVATALKRCSSLGDYQSGIRVFFTNRSFIAGDILLATASVDMFAKCGSMEEARMVFEKMPCHDIVCWNALLLGYVLHNQADLALQLFWQMQQVDGRTLVAALMACSQNACLEQGQQVDGKMVKLCSLQMGFRIHSQAAEAGLDSEMFVASTLVDMYAKCGSMEDARRVFERCSGGGGEDVVMWTSLLNGYANNEEAEETLQLFEKMKLALGSCAPNARTFVAVIKACCCLASREQGTRLKTKLVKTESLERGRSIHLEAANCGWSSDIFVGNCLVDMYAKCGSMEDASTVFYSMPRRSVVSWTALMLGYVDNGEPELCLQLFQTMMQHKDDDATCAPNARTMVAALQACASLAAKEEGRYVHGRLVKVQSLEIGMAIHAQALRGGFGWDPFVANTLVDMYGKCGSMVDAWAVFSRMQQRDVVSWNALILGYAVNGEAEAALELFFSSLMNCKPSARTYVGALMACASLASDEEAKAVDGKFVKMECLNKGLAIHKAAEQDGFESDMFVASSLINTYGDCGSMLEARAVFDKVIRYNQGMECLVSWNALISGYAQNGEPELALRLFSQVEAPDRLTFVAALMACCSWGEKIKQEQEADAEAKEKLLLDCLDQGMAIHRQAAAEEVEDDMMVANTLIDMYAKCGSLVDARSVFDRMRAWSVVSWTSLIKGCLENGERFLALQLFASMEAQCGCKPDGKTMAAALKACCNLAVEEAGEFVHGKLVKLRCLEKGMELHSQAVAAGFMDDLVVANCVVAMYAKCGSMVDASLAFQAMRRRDVVSWTSLILGYAENGEPEVAVDTFARMKIAGCTPDDEALAAALVACGSLVAVEAGKQIHVEICRIGAADDRENRGKVKGSTVANCLVDFYAKCGSMIAAQLVFDSIANTRDDIVAWNSLLAGYSRQGDAERVLELFQRLNGEGLKADRITFVCLLVACDHAGLIRHGTKYLTDMSSKHGIAPSVQHYSCVIDMLSRASQQSDAVKLLEEMPFEADTVTWTSVLASGGY